jgi:hypothetical protein
MEEFVPKIKTAPLMKDKESYPEEISCHYIYICKKPFIPTPEPSEQGEEEEEEEQNNYRY